MWNHNTLFPRINIFSLWRLWYGARHEQGFHSRKPRQKMTCSTHLCFCFCIGELSELFNNVQLTLEHGCDLLCGMKSFLSVVVVTLLLFSGCTQNEKAREVLENAGYSNIELTGYRLWLKGKDDDYSTGFRALAPNGRTVTGAVTGGIFKGNTIRFD